MEREQLPDLHIQRVRNLDEIQRGDIPLSAFNAAVVSAVNVSETGELFLR